MTTKKLTYSELRAMADEISRRFHEDIESLIDEINASDIGFGRSANCEEILSSLLYGPFEKAMYALDRELRKAETERN